jgi:hypothetical protein
MAFFDRERLLVGTVKSVTARRGRVKRDIYFVAAK